jgi:hypothetical protein
MVTSRTTTTTTLVPLLDEVSTVSTTSGVVEPEVAAGLEVTGVVDEVRGCGDVDATVLVGVFLGSSATKRRSALA